MAASFADFDAADRVAALARATLELDRGGSPGHAAAWRERAERLDAMRRASLATDAAPLLASGAANAAGAASAAILGAEDGVLRARARLELELKTREGELDDLRKNFETEKADHREAKSTLQLQRTKLREIQDERESLLKHVKDAESRLRLAENQREQIELELDKLKNKRQAVGDQAVKHQEQINALQSEIERLTAELVQARSEGKREVTVAREEVKTAVADSHKPVLGELWGRLNKAFPDIFVETHVPNRETFERVCEGLIEMMSVLGALEVRGRESLSRLKDVANPQDRIGALLERFSRAPGLKAVLRDYVAGGAGTRIGNLKNLLSAMRSLHVALANGQYRAIVRLPDLLSGELDPSKWQIQGARRDDAAIGKYYKETVRKAIPDQIGTAMRRQANVGVADEFMEEMRSGG